MPKIIWKFEIPPSPRPPMGTGMCEVHMPVGSEIIYLDKQRGVPQLWVLFNPDTVEHEYRKFLIVGTGKIVPDNTTYIGSWQMEDGELIWHLFEITNP